MDRGYQRFRVFAVDAQTGASQTLVDDQAKTFIDSTNLYVHVTDDGREVLYASERDGWRHLYLADGENGTLKNQITRGAWVVRRVDKVDEAARQVWFAARRTEPRPRTPICSTTTASISTGRAWSR